MATAFTADSSRSARRNSSLRIATYSSAVRPLRVSSRQSARSLRAPSNRPSEMFVLPTSMASRNASSVDIRASVARRLRHLDAQADAAVDRAHLHVHPAERSRHLAGADDPLHGAAADVDVILALVRAPPGVARVVVRAGVDHLDDDGLVRIAVLRAHARVAVAVGAGAVRVTLDLEALAAVLF